MVCFFGASKLRYTHVIMDMFGNSTNEEKFPRVGTLSNWDIAHCVDFSDLCLS